MVSHSSNASNYANNGYIGGDINGNYRNDNGANESDCCPVNNDENHPIEFLNRNGVSLQTIIKSSPSHLRSSNISKNRWPIRPLVYSSSGASEDNAYTSSSCSSDIPNNWLHKSPSHPISCDNGNEDELLDKDIFSGPEINRLDLFRNHPNYRRRSSRLRKKKVLFIFYYYYLFRDQNIEPLHPIFLLIEKDLVIGKVVGLGENITTIPRL